MNSKIIKKNFPDIYKDFYSRNDLILSGCFNFSWSPTPGSSHLSNFIRIKSKIPLKCYIGFKKRKDNKISFGNVFNYSLNGKKFETVDYIKVNKEQNKVEEIIREFLNENNYIGGLDIEILSEVSRGHSFGFSGTSGAIIAAGLFTLIGKLKKDDFSNFNKLEAEDFDKIYKLGLKLDFVSRYGNTIGENVINTLKQSQGLTYFISEKFDANLDINKLENIKYEHKNIELSEIPLDYYMVFSGIMTDTKLTEQYKTNDSEEFHKYEEFLIEHLLKETNINNIQFEKFKEKGSMYSSLSDNISVLNVKTLEIFTSIAKRGYDVGLIEKIIENINDYRSTISIIEQQNNFAEYIIRYFNKYKSNPEEIIGIYPSYTGKLGGGYVIAVKQSISRNTIKKTLGEIRNIYLNVAIEYCSFEDGEIKDGVILEQYVSNGIFSEYIQKDKFILQDLSGESYIGNYNELLEKTKTGLLLDLINNKIYINGEKLTSKDIPSQNTTIEIILKLLENIGKDISNKELPASTYSKSKGEMIGKIIVPITKIIEEKMGEKIELICKGSFTDFYIKLDNPKITISILKKI